MEAIVLALALFAAPPAPCPNPACFCSPCRCASCTCKTSGCQCAGCKPVAAEPVEIVLVTAEEWCEPCQLLKPHWDSVSHNNPICRTLDISDSESDDAKEARKHGVRNLPTLLRLVNGRKERSMVVAGLSEEGLRQTVQRWSR